MSEFNEYKHDFSRLQEVTDKCRAKGVWFELNYSECDNSWYIGISSSAESERTMTKNRDFDSTINRAIEWLDSL